MDHILNAWVRAIAPLSFLADLDAPPPAPWGAQVMPPPDREPMPQEERPPVQEPWSGPLEPIREPGEPAQRWRLH